MKSNATTSALTVQGRVASVSSGHFTISLIGGCGSGYFNVYTNSSTAYRGGQPAVGHQAVASGNGSCSTQMTASGVISAVPSSMSLSGTVANIYADGSGFTMNSSSCGSIHVYKTSSTSGNVSSVGQQTSVNGSGSCLTYIAASSIGSGSSGTTSVPKHVLTSDFLGKPWGTTSVAWSSAAPYLTWAETGTTSATAIAATGIKTMTYVDPNRTTAGTGDPLYNTNDATFSHTCSGARIYDKHDNVIEWTMNPGSAALRSLFANYVSSIRSRAHFDALWEDNASPPSASAPYDPFYPAMPCDYSDSAWNTNTIGMNQDVSLPVVVNGLSGLDGHNVSVAMGELNGSNTIGAVFEGCYTATNEKKAPGWYWLAIENSEIQTIARGKLFECMAEDTAPANEETDSRLYTYASFLLTYTPTKGMYRTEYHTPSGFHVMPESKLVPLSPTTSAPASITGLQTPGGTYARRFSACYLSGSSVGGCAVVVNPDVYPHPFPYSGFHHTLVISGNGVLDGGTVSTAGSAPPTTVPAKEAVIAFP